MALRRESYRLADERHETILVACSKCDWRAGCRGEELVDSYGEAFPMPTLLNKLAKPGCDRLGDEWDACGVHYAQPIDVKA
jgi:hypothetical protein